VKQLSHRALLLQNGRVDAVGEPGAVINRYVGLVLERQNTFENLFPRREQKSVSYRHGDRTSEVMDVLLTDETGKEVSAISPGELITVRIRIRFNHSCVEPIVGVLVRTRIGMDVFGTNTKIEQLALGNLEAGTELTINFIFRATLTPQQYTLTVATQNNDGTSHDWLDDVIAFEVIAPVVRAGVVDLKPQLSWTVLKDSSAATISL